MGLAKERFTRGLSFVDGAVCARCLGDVGLADFVEGIASEQACDFCGAESESDPIAAPVDEVVDYMADCLERHSRIRPTRSVGAARTAGGSVSRRRTRMSFSRTSWGSTSASTTNAWLRLVDSTEHVEADAGQAPAEV